MAAVFLHPPLGPRGKRSVGPVQGLERGGIGFRNITPAMENQMKMNWNIGECRGIPYCIV